MESCHGPSTASLTGPWRARKTKTKPTAIACSGSVAPKTSSRPSITAARGCRCPSNANYTFGQAIAFCGLSSFVPGFDRRQETIVCPTGLLITLLVLIPTVVNLEHPVLLGVHANPFAFAILVHIGDKRIGRIMLLAAAHREVQLPYVRRARRVVDVLPGLRRAALARAVVHQRHLRCQRVHPLR